MPAGCALSGWGLPACILTQPLLGPTLGWQEREHRRSVWSSNLERIVARNARSLEAGHSLRVGALSEGQGRGGGGTALPQGQTWMQPVRGMWRTEHRYAR